MQYSVLKKSELENEFTIGAEFYHPYFVEMVNQVSAKKHKLLSEICDKITDGDHSATQYTTDGVLYLLSESIKEGIINKNVCRYISYEHHKSLRRSQLKPGDILLTKTGVYFGKSAVVPENYPEANTSAHVGVITAKNILNPYYLSTFLNAKHGYSQVRRRGIKASRPEVKLIELSDIKVFIPSEQFQNNIEFIIKRATDVDCDSEQVYQHAQSILLDELGLSNWQPKHQLSFVKNYSDADKAGRMDAEYFQPKYDEIEKAIKSYPGGYSFIGKEFKQNKSVLTPDVEHIYQYVEIGSINVSNGEITASEVVGAELPDNAKRLLKKDDVIVSKVRTYRGGMAIVDRDGLIGSGAFTVLHEKGQINKETLLTFLRSKPLLAWSLKPNTGTSYPVILDEDILNLPIPQFSKDIQLKVKQKKTESFNLHKQSKQLLECAKRAVEIAIEQDEDAAMKWLKEQTEGDFSSISRAVGKV